MEEPLGLQNGFSHGYQGGLKIAPFYFQVKFFSRGALSEKNHSEPVFSPKSDIEYPVLNLLI